MDNTRTLYSNEMNDAQRLSLVEGDVGFMGLLLIVLSIFSYTADLINDTLLARDHYLNEDYWYFGFTIAFVVVPGWTIAVQVWPELSKGMEKKPKAIQVSTWICHWIVPASPIVRNIVTFYYAIQLRNRTRQHIILCNLRQDEEWDQLVKKASLIEEKNLSQMTEVEQQFVLQSRNYVLTKEKDVKSQIAETFRLYYKWMDENILVSLLSLSESFMEEAPQLLLQLYIIVVHTDRYSIKQVVSVIFSGISLASTLTSMSISYRWEIMSQRKYVWKTPEKIDTWTLRWYHFVASDLVTFLGHLLCVFARFTALVLFASEFHQMLIIYCSIRLILMTTWSIRQYVSYLSWDKESFYKKVGECLFMSILNIFSYVRTDDDHTERNLFWSKFHFTVYFVENVTMMVAWWLTVTAMNDLVKQPWYYQVRTMMTAGQPWYDQVKGILIAGQLVSFALGAALLFSYQGLYPRKFKDYLNGERAPVTKTDAAETCYDKAGKLSRWKRFVTSVGSASKFKQ